MHILQIILMIVQAVMMLFMLRALMQSANSFYYHPFTQAVIKLTDPVLNLLPFKNNRVAGLQLCFMRRIFSTIYLSQTADVSRTYM